MASLRYSAYNLVNLGCGSRHHPDWFNISLRMAQESSKNNLRSGMPLSGASHDVVRPLQNATFFCQARKAKILTAGIH